MSLAPRRLKSWIDSYVEWTAQIQSPTRFRVWVALATISASLQRKVWTRIVGQNQYANVYYVLVGPPGVGKGNAMRPAERLIREIKSVHMAPQGITRRSFYSSLEQAAESDLDMQSQELKRHCSLTAFIAELGVFLRSGDLDFMYHLADAFDNPAIFHYKTEHAGEHYIENASFTMLGAVTPKGLKDILTDDALNMGFPARLVLVWGEGADPVPLFSERKSNSSLREDLLHDLQEINNLRGAYVWTDGAKRFLEDWFRAGLGPLPRDQRLEHYNTRRLTQISKLAILLSASHGNDLAISERDVGLARDLLLDTESEMHKAISSLGANPLLAQQKFALALIDRFWQKTGRGIPEAMLIEHLSSEVHPQYMRAFVETLAQSANVGTRGDPGSRTFAPRAKMKQRPKS